MKKRYLRMVRRAFRALRHRRLRNKVWWVKLTRPLFDPSLWKPCRDTVAGGLAIGLFFSMMLMPFQMLAAAVLAMRLRVNVPFAMAACWITNPLTQVPILIAQFRLGEWLHHTVGVPIPGVLARVGVTVPGLGSVNAASFVLGMVSSGLLLGLVAYPLVHVFSAFLPQFLPSVPLHFRRKLAARKRRALEARAARAARARG